jgi:hypothetical protein
MIRDWAASMNTYKKQLITIVSLLWLTPVVAEVMTIDFEEFVGVSPLVPLSSKGYAFSGYGSGNFEDGYGDVGIGGPAGDRHIEGWGWQDSCWTFGHYIKINFEREDGGPFALHSIDLDGPGVSQPKVVGVGPNSVAWYPSETGTPVGTDGWLELERVEIVFESPAQFCPSPLFEIFADNIVVEEIFNATIDYQPWDSSNTIRPNDAYLVTVGVKTESIADGDARDFDASLIDSSTVKLGLASNNAIPLLLDLDDDGDNDRVFGFRMEETGITCLDSSVKLVGKLTSGAVIAGTDSVTRTDCEEAVAIDFDPNNAANLVWPEAAYFTTIGIKTMNSADGDALNFDATQVNADSIQIGPAAAPNGALPLAMDFDSDGDTDLIIGFRVEDAGINCSDTEIVITGETHGGQLFTESDNITTTDCSTGTCHP